MTLKNNLAGQPIYVALLTKRMLIGAAIALTLITLFLTGVNNPNPAWPKLWMLRPLIIVPLAGATGGAFFYLLVDHFHIQNSWKKFALILVSVLVYLFGLWIGTVLGLDGTLWN